MRAKYACESNKKLVLTVGASALMHAGDGHTLTRFSAAFTDPKGASKASGRYNGSRYNRVYARL